MRRKAITNPDAAREAVQRIDAARGHVPILPPERPRPDSERRDEQRRVEFSFPVERQSTVIKLDQIARTNSVSEFNLVFDAVESARLRAREDPSQFGMSLADAASALGVSTRMVEKYIEAGKVRAEQMRGVGPRLFINRDDVARLGAERAKAKKKGTAS
jgi:hypothetical protein